MPQARRSSEALEQRAPECGALLRIGTGAQLVAQQQAARSRVLGHAPRGSEMRGERRQAPGRATGSSPRSASIVVQLRHAAALAGRAPAAPRAQQRREPDGLQQHRLAAHVRTAHEQHARCRVERRGRAARPGRARAASRAADGARARAAGGSRRLERDAADARSAQRRVRCSASRLDQGLLPVASSAGRAAVTSSASSRSTRALLGDSARAARAARLFDSHASSGSTNSDCPLADTSWTMPGAGAEAGRWHERHEAVAVAGDVARSHRSARAHSLELSAGARRSKPFGGRRRARCAARRQLRCRRTRPVGLEGALAPLAQVGQLGQIVGPARRGAEARAQLVVCSTPRT